MVTEEAGTGAQVMDREDPGAQRDQEGLTPQEVPHIVGHQGQGEGGLAELLVATGIGIDLLLDRSRTGQINGKIVPSLLPTIFA